MKHAVLPTLILALSTVTGFAQELHTFANSEGKTLEDSIVKYDFEERIVTLDKNGKIPIETFGEADQAYILNWNQVNGFMSSMRFKMEIKKNNWARMKYEQTVTPFFMDAIQIPKKKNPVHNVMMVDDYEEYNAIYMEAEGYTISLRNQNFFPIENLVVESKIFYEQEYYITPDSLFLSMESEFYDTVTSNKVRFLSETIPVIIPRETVDLYSECAIVVDHQLERNSLISNSEVDGEDEETTETITEGFGEWDDHGRRRTGKVNGVWFRIGIKGTDGKMVWREIAAPSSITEKFLWDPPAVEPATEDSK